MTTETTCDLAAIDHELFVAAQEIENIPYTAPEVILARARQLVPIAEHLVAEVRSLRQLRDKRAAAMTDDVHPKYAPEGTLAYKIPLIPGTSRYAYLELPEDMSTDECSRLGRFIKSIALVESLSIDGETSVCLNSRRQCAYLCTCEPEGSSND